MKRFNISILALLLVILSLNISFAQYSTTAKSVKSDKGNAQTDLNNLFIYAGQATSEIINIKSTMAVITSEVQAISNNISNIEDTINTLKTNDQTQETLLATVTSEINLLKTDISNLQKVITDDFDWATAEIALITAEINFIKTNMSTLEAYLKSEVTRLDLNLSTHETELTAIKANISTHENELNALKANATTTEAKLVRATASYENRYKKVFLNYGYPIAINDLWDENKAADVHAQYDIIVIGDGYEKETHEVHQSTTNIINKVRAIKTDVEVFGYIPIGGELGANLSTDEIMLRMNEWKSMNVTGIFLDEFGYDYKVSRERQNMCVDYAHSLGLNIIANSWNIDWVFNNDNGYVDWIPFYGNPNLVPPSIGANDYYLFENLFYFYENSTQKASDQWRIYEVYRYYYDSATSTWGMNYYDKFHTKTIGLDGIYSANANKDLYFVNGYIGGRILNLDGYGASIEDWGASVSNYIHYNPSFFNNETSIFNRAKIQPTVSTYSGATYAQYNTLISGNTLKLLWKPGTSVNSPTQGTRKVQVNGVDRSKCYVSSSATNANVVNTLVQRDSSGNFSAGTITASLTGNASTATTLATARNIAGVSFNGSADIAIPHGNLTGIGTITHANLELNLSTIEALLGTHTTKIDSTEAYLLKWLPTTTEAGYLYYDTTEAKVKWQMVTSGGTGVTDHTLLSNIGTKTHAQLEIDISGMQSAISALQANPGGLTGLSVNGETAFTGEVKLTAGSNVTLTQTGNTVEVSAASSTAEINFVEHLNYVNREQGTAEVGYYSVYFFNLPVANTVLNSISVYMNGIKQYKEGGIDCVISTWTDNDVVKYKVIFNKNVEAISSVWVSYFTGVTSVEYSDIWIPYFNDATKEQGTSEVGYFSVLKFNVSEAELLTSSIQYMENGLTQTPNVDYIKGTWDDNGTAKVQITLINHSISATDEIAISFIRPNVSLANIADSYISTTRMGSSTVNEALQSAEVKLIALQAEIDSLENALSSAGGKAIEDIGTYISDNKTWEFSTNYDTSCIVLYRNRLLQPRSLFTSSVVSNKIRVSFLTAIDASDEICLISSK